MLGKGYAGKNLRGNLPARALGALTMPRQVPPVGGRNQETVWGRSLPPLGRYRCRRQKMAEERRRCRRRQSRTMSGPLLKDSRETD